MYLTGISFQWQNVFFYDDAKVADHLKAVGNFGYGYTRNETVDLASSLVKEAREITWFWSGSEDSSKGGHSWVFLNRVS